MIKKNILLKDKTSFRVGGTARYLAEVLNVDQLNEVIRLISKEKIPFWVIGKGTNLLISDSGLNGVVIILKGDFKKVIIEKNKISAGGAAGFPTIARMASKQGLTGLEFAVGIPGTLAGAIVMNAGTGEHEIKNVLKRVYFMTARGVLKELPVNRLKMKYRSSRFQSANDIICSAELKLKKGKIEEIIKKMKKYESHRRKTQPIRMKNAGCIFKNPETVSAGYLIDRAGLKGKCYGDAEISTLHANFIVNRGSASASDVVRLIRYARKKVSKKFNINLKLEIKPLGFSYEI